MIAFRIPLYGETFGGNDGSKEFIH